MTNRTKIIIGAVIATAIGLLIWRNTHATFLAVTVTPTNTQAVFSYTSTIGGACTIEVSPSNTYSPVVNDASSTLFSNANLDSAHASSTTGLQRLVVIGKRSADVALDGNRYSRALQDFTTYYYRVTCGSDVGTGSFTTQTLPSGLTYSDTIPSTGDATGTPAWPTLFNDRTQQIIDPQTGLLISRLSLASDNTGGFFPSSLSLSFGPINPCSNTLVADGTGAMGYHCMFSGVVFWINPTTGAARPVGIPSTNYDNVLFGNTEGCSNMDSVNPNRFYCILNDNNGYTVVAAVVYNGTNTPFTSNWPTCNGSNAPCTTQSILTPGASNNIVQLMHNFDNGYPLNWNVNGYLPQIRAVQNGKIFIDHINDTQDSYAWLGVFDPGNNVPIDQASTTAKMLGVMSTYQKYPIRWCSDHAINPAGDMDFMSVASNNLRSGTGPGFGEYTSNIVSGNMSSATSTCPGNPFGKTVCSTIVVDGEPCNTTQTTGISTSTACGIPTANFLQNAQPGDIFGIDPISRDRYYNEFVQLIQKVGNTWTVARGVNQTPITSHSTGALDAICTAHDTVQSNYDLGSWFWDYTNDPHGTGTPGTTILFDKNSTNSHGSYGPYKFIQIGSNFYNVRSGLPSAVVNSAGYNMYDSNPSFAGVTGIGIPNSVDSHPSAVVNDKYFYDGRPDLGGLTYGVGTSLGSNIYKYAAGAITLNRKQQPTVAFSNEHLLVDISGPSSNIASSTDYTYCVVVNAGECYSGSLAGEVYAKVSTATESDCPLHAIGGAGWTDNYICISDSSMYNQGMAQVGTNVYGNAKNGRMLGHGLTTYGREDQFWTIRGTPDNSNLLFNLPADPIYGSGSGQLFMATLPPYSADTQPRDDFMQVPITAAAVASTTVAKIQFGYEEFGSSTSFYCTSRKEACVKGNQSGTTYDFASANPTGMPCVSGCTINLPLIPERVAFYQIDYYNGSTLIAFQNGVALSNALGSPLVNTQPLIYVNGYPNAVKIGAGARINILGQ